MMIIYIILLLFLIYIAVIYNSVPFIFLAGVGLMLPLFLVVVLIPQCILLKISFGKQKRFLEQEEETKIALSVWNQTVFPIKQIVIKVKMKNLTTEQKQKRWVKTSLHTKENEILLPASELSYGVWQISCEKIRVYDLLQWFHLRKWKRVEQEMIRLPRRYEVNLKKGALEYDSPWEQEEYEPWKTGADASHIREIREYQPGDKPRSIHWKLSAKKEQLLVKEYGQPSGSKLLFGLDMNGLTNTDMELIYSLLYACAEKSISLLLIWRSPGEEQMLQCEIQQEEDAYWAMESLMRKNIACWKTEKPVEFEHQLWLKDKKLYLDGMEIQDFSQGNLQEKLLDMELML